MQDTDKYTKEELRAIAGPALELLLVATTFHNKMLKFTLKMMGKELTPEQAYVELVDAVDEHITDLFRRTKGVARMLYRSTGGTPTDYEYHKWVSKQECRRWSRGGLKRRTKP